MQLKQRGSQGVALIAALLIHILILFMLLGTFDDSLRKLGILPPEPPPQQHDPLVAANIPQQPSAPVMFVEDEEKKPEIPQPEPEPKTPKPEPDPVPEPEPQQQEQLVEAALEREQKSDSPKPEAEIAEEDDEEEEGDKEPDEEQSPEEVTNEQNESDAEQEPITEERSLSLQELLPEPVLETPRQTTIVNSQPQLSPDLVRALKPPTVTHAKKSPRKKRRSKNITLADITRDFLATLETERVAALTTQGNKSGHPSEDQLRRTRYIRKVLSCLSDAYHSLKRYEPRMPMPHEMRLRIAINHQGRLSDLSIDQGSGSPEIDTFVTRIFQEAESAIPPTPTSLASRNKHEMLQFTIKHPREFSMIDGWVLSQ